MSTFQMVSNENDFQWQQHIPLLNKIIKTQVITIPTIIITFLVYEIIIQLYSINGNEFHKTFEVK